MGGWYLSHVAPKFERLLDTFRREDGRRWSGIQLERATGDIVTRSYVTNLRKGRMRILVWKSSPRSPRRWASPRRSGSRRGYPERMDEEPRGRPRGSRAGSSA